MNNILLNQFTEDFDHFLARIIETIPSLLFGVFILVLFFTLSRISPFVVRKLIPASKRNTTFSLLMKNVVKSGFVGIGIIAFLVIIGVDFSALVTSLGLIGFAVGFAFKDIIQNLLSGLLILIQKPFGIGDAIAVGDKHGTVRDIKTRYTILKSYDGNQYIIPNSMILSQTLVRYTAYRKKRISIQFNLHPDVPFRKVSEVITETLAGMEGVLELPKPRVTLVRIDGQSLVIQVRYWYARGSIDIITLKTNVTEAILAQFAAHKMQLAAPVPMSAASSKKGAA
jgi:small conductance mechanosensitive channel